MSQYNSMRQIGIRNMGFKVQAMEWSSKMDLIAIGNEKGEVLIQRLNWQKVYTLPAPGENIQVTALSWQPEEAVVAVAYSNSIVTLLDVEKEFEIFSINYPSPVKSIHWTKITGMPEADEILKSSEKDNTNDNFLPPLPNLSALSSSAKQLNTTSFFTKRLPCFLVISLESGQVFALTFGVLPCGNIEIQAKLDHPNNFEVFDVRMGASYDEILVFVRDGDMLKLLTYKNEILSKHMVPLLNVAIKHGHIFKTQNYLSETIECIVESWETVLLEMDNKLTKYANSQPSGTLSADLLELLMFGVPSPDLDQFLTNELTEKGLKKLANSTELSYTTIQNLVTKPLQTSAVYLFYYLNSILGMTKNSYDYKYLLCPEATNEAIRACGALIMKIIEMQQVIDQCLNDMKVFWGWLCVVIVRLMDENVSEEMSQNTQEDTLYLAEYLNNFDECIVENEDGTVVKKKFNLEKVGQYLTEADLQQPIKTDTFHRWNQLLAENECLRECPLILPHDRNLSLIQQHNQFESAIHKLFAQPNKMMGVHFDLKYSVTCGNVDPGCKVPVGFLTCESKNLIALSFNQTDVLILDLESGTQIVRCCRMSFTPSPFSGDHALAPFDCVSILDLQFYNEHVLSLLVQKSCDGRHHSYFVQLPVEMVREKSTLYQIVDSLDLTRSSIRHSFYDALDMTYFKPIEGACNSIAVSGNRKVTAVLSDNYKKVKIFEMEGDDEEEEADLSNNSILDTSANMQVETSQENL